ncbi:hypothetical protein ID866_4197 [Astraeus odoratus]|nr:hypothetical protein ID866_4197 [Astraeus odoratus]
MTVLNDDDLDLGIVEKIWNAIKSVCPRSLQLAVDDVVRTTQDEEHIVVLGRKVFKAPSGERWPLHAWGHMVAIHRCYSCLRATCKTVDAIIDLTRYILLTGAQLTRSYLKCDYNFDSARELMLAGFIPSYLPMTEPRYFTATHRDHPHSDPVWEETKRNLVLYGALSFNDPKARAFVNGCFRHPDLMVMVRQGATGRVIRSAPVVWISRKRCARTSSDLASIPWEKATDIVLCQEKVLEAAQPVGWNHKNITDCLQVVIIDRSEGDMGDFVHKLVQIWCQVYRVKDQVELQTALEEPYEVAGELEKHIRVAEVDTLRSYQNLWPTMLSGVSVKKLMDLAETHA